MINSTDLSERYSRTDEAGLVSNSVTLNVLPVFLQDIVTRHLTEKNAADEHLPTRSPVAWAADSQSELTPSESLASSDSVRNTLSLPSMSFSHMSNFVPALESHPTPCSFIAFPPLICFISSSAWSPFILSHVAFDPSVLLFMLSF